MANFHSLYRDVILATRAPVVAKAGGSLLGANRSLTAHLQPCAIRGFWPQCGTNQGFQASLKFRRFQALASKNWAYLVLIIMRRLTSASPRK